MTTVKVITATLSLKKGTFRKTLCCKFKLREDKNEMENFSCSILQQLNVRPLSDKSDKIFCDKGMRNLQNLSKN